VLIISQYIVHKKGMVTHVPDIDEKEEEQPAQTE